MRLEIAAKGQKREVVIEERGTVGGGQDDSVRVDGLPPRTVELWPEGPVWMVRTAKPGRVNGVPFPAHLARVWCEGERIELSEVASLLHVSERGEPAGGTAAVVKDLLGDNEAVATSALPVLICLTGVDGGRRFRMSAERVVIGRADGCELQLRDGSVSRRHARIERLSDRYWIEDLDSPNGVFVNGRRISRRAVIRDGVVIELGQTLLRFDAPGTAKEADATPRMPAAIPAPASLSASPRVPVVVLNPKKSSEPPPLPLAAENPPRLDTGKALPGGSDAPPPKLVVLEGDGAHDDGLDDFVAANAPEAERERLGRTEALIAVSGAALALVGLLAVWVCIG